MTLMMIMMERYFMSKHVEDRGQRNVLDTSSSKERQESAKEDAHSRPETKKKTTMRYL